MAKDDDRLERMERVLSRIETAVLGDAEAGHLGLVSRMNNHAGRIRDLERVRAWYTAIVVGGGAVIAVIYKLVSDYWPRK